MSSDIITNVKDEVFITMASNNGNKKNQYKRRDDNNKEIECLEFTNSLDIIIDNDRLTDKDTLDISFVDDKKKKRKTVDKIVESMEEDENYNKISKDVVSELKKKNNEVFTTFLIVLFSFILGFLVCIIWARETDVFTKTETVTKTVTKTETVVDDNYVFLGDSIFAGYDLEEYFEGMSVVNSGINGHKTTDILKNMEERIYRYNPSKVFILIGTNDLNGDISVDETIENVGKIVDGIKENRPYAEIYVQSIYPINNTDDNKIRHSVVGERNNEDIQTMNKGIEKLCKEKKVTYMNIYDLLVSEDGNLELDYTVEGLHISKDGYKIITQEIMKVLGEEEAS